MKIHSLSDVPLRDIHRCFIDAFSDYVEPVKATEDELRYVLERRAFRAELSFGAFEGDQLVGFILNGHGSWNGLDTAYDAGTGILKEWRKKGIASSLFETSLPVLREHGVRQYLLEVIKSNTGAYELYRKSGFSVTREFDYWVSGIEALTLRPKKLPGGASIHWIDTPDWDLFRTFWDFEPSWQNSIDAIVRKMDNMTLLGAFDGGNIVAYGCMENHTGDLPQLAVHPDFRRRGLATSLVRRLLNLATPPGLRVINTCSNALATRRFLRSLGLVPGPGQYEMILGL